MAPALKRKQRSFVNEMLDNARAISQTLNRRVNGQQGDVWMKSTRGKLATFARNIKCAETDQSFIRVTVDPNSAVTKLDSLRNVVLQQLNNEWISERPS